MTPSQNNIETALSRHRFVEYPALPGRTNHLHTGVLVPLFWRFGVSVVVIKRPQSMRQHPGEIAFPGGRPDPEDADLQSTAARECHEEIGLRPSRWLGRLSSTPLYTSDYRIEPYVGELLSTNFRPNDAEVASIHLLPIGRILNQPQIFGIPYELQGRQGLSPLFDVEGHWMFGATAHVFLELLTVLAPVFGKPLPPMVKGPVGWKDLLG